MSEDKLIDLGPAILGESRGHLLLLQGVISWIQHKSTDRHISFQGHFFVHFPPQPTPTLMVQTGKSWVLLLFTWFDRGMGERAGGRDCWWESKLGVRSTESMTTVSLIIKAVMPLKASSLRPWVHIAVLETTCSAPVWVPDSTPAWEYTLMQFSWASVQGLCCAASFLSKQNKVEVVVMVLCTATLQIFWFVCASPAVALVANALGQALNWNVHLVDTA